MHLLKSAKLRQWGADAVLLCVAFIWGSTFVIVKDALESTTVFAFLGQRFGLAFLIFLPFLWRFRQSFRRQCLSRGGLLGLFLFGAFAFQTIGLTLTTATNTAFVTGMNVVLVPIFNALFFGRLVPGSVMLGICLAATGLAALCLGSSLTVNPGDAIVLACAACIAMQIILTGRYAKDDSTVWLAGIQIGTVAFLSIGCAGLRGEPVLVWKPEIFWALMLCAVLASSFAFWAQTAMQRYTIPSKAALIFCMEPVFGAVCAWLVRGEQLGGSGVFGAGLIVVGMLLAEAPQGSLKLKRPLQGRTLDLKQEGINGDEERGNANL